MNALAGRDAVAHCQQDWYHRVIGNYFDSEDFTYSADKDDYLLYLGRIGGNKGVDIAIDLAKTTGKQLVIAGQGTLKSMGYTNLPDNIVEFGYADADQRRTLMSRAQALFIGSTYLEPFAGVQVEAWLSGTPVISPDWAAFAEMNVHGLTGIRCNTFKDFVQATEEVKLLKPADCRRHGEQWLLENIAPKYERYFEDVLNVYTGKGWYTL
jgi:glycosyltransferase involved in cell wall biosynthesis